MKSLNQRLIALNREFKTKGKVVDGDNFALLITKVSMRAMVLMDARVRKGTKNFGPGKKKNPSVQGVNLKKHRIEYSVWSLFSLEEVLPFSCYGEEGAKKSYTAAGQEFMIKMNSSRYAVFKRSVKCCSCDRVGNAMYLESGCKGRIETPHFNMYCVGTNGSRVLMTQDHIVPRSKGGGDELDNLQTMCCICNTKKGNQVSDELLRQYEETKRRGLGGGSQETSAQEGRAC